MRTLCHGEIWHDKYQVNMDIVNGISMEYASASISFAIRRRSLLSFTECVGIARAQMLIRQHRLTTNMRRIENILAQRINSILPYGPKRTSRGSAH